MKVFVLYTYFVLCFISPFTFGQTTSPYDSLLYHIGNIQSAHPDSAMDLIQSIKGKAHSQNDLFAIMKINTFEGLDYYYKSEYDSASVKYFKALELAEKIGDRLQKGIILNNLGSLYFDIEQYSSAQTYYDSAYQIMLQANNVKWLSKITGNYAGVLFMKGETDQSIELLKASIAYGLQAKSYISVAGAYGNLAMVLSSTNKEEDALAIFEKGIQMLDSVGDKRGVCIVQQRLGELLSSLGEFEKAESLLYKTLQLSYSIEHSESVMNTHLTLSKFYEQTHQKTVR